MVKNIFIIGLLFQVLTTHSQVGVNTTSPSATLDVVSSGTTSSTKAFEVNNSSNAELVTILDNGNVGIGASSPTNKLHVNSTNPIKIEGLQQGTTTDEILTVEATGIVKKMTRFNLGLSQSAFFTVPAATWNSAGATKSWMTNLTTGTATTTERSLHESLSTTDQAKMLTFEGLRLDALNYGNGGVFIRPKFFNTTSSTINYSLTSQHVTNEVTHINANINTSHYNLRIDGDDIIYAGSTNFETLIFDVYFTNGNHYQGNIASYRISDTYYFFMNVKKI